MKQEFNEKLTKEMMAFMESSSKATMDYYTTMQSNISKLMAVIQEEAKAAQENSKTTFEEWTEKMKESQANLSKMATQNMEKMGGMFGKK